MLQFLAKLWSEMKGCFMDSSNEYFNEGWEAYHQFYLMDDNPYPDGSMAACDWQTGWEAASNADED